MPKKKKQEEQEEKDLFVQDWEEARAYWKEKHKIFDYSYLSYRSILAFNDIYGEDYLKAFGLNAYVPRTFQTVEGIKSAVFPRKTSFVIEGNDFKSDLRANYMEIMDNAEWERSGAEVTKCEAEANAFIFGFGYLFNPYEHKVENYDYAKVKDNDNPDEAEKGDNEGLEQYDESIVWEKREKVVYSGVKPKSLDPYYVFPDPLATCDDDRAYTYVYTPIRVRDLKKFVIENGIMTKEEAEELIKPGEVEYFDSVRNVVDSLYQLPITQFSRGDHQTVNQTPNTVERRDFQDMTAIIEKFENNCYEIRLASDINNTLYKDYNVYDHKEQPIITFFDNKIPGKYDAIGEPEVIRWQQISENKVHNAVLQALMVAVNQRYAINSAFLEDEEDIGFWSPYRPIRLKSIPGANISNAIMPMPQPDVKQSPFKLMELINDVIQKSTGASDFVVSTSESKTDTATESENLMQATGGRMKEKVRYMEEYSLKRLINQWHHIFYQFYSEEMDLLISGDNHYFRYLPYSRIDYNEDPDMVKKTRDELSEVLPNGVVGDTVEELYINAGYKDVVYLSDLDGNFGIKVKVTDIENDKHKQIQEATNITKLMIEANKQAQVQGSNEQFDVFGFIKEAIELFPFIKDVDDYTIKNNRDIMNMTDTMMPNAGGSANKLSTGG